MHRLAWRLGWFVPPPHLASFGTNVAFLGTFFGLAWGLFMGVAVWIPQGIPALFQVAAAVLAGVLFGLSMAAMYRRGARKYQLPQWSHFREQHVSGET